MFMLFTLSRIAGDERRAVVSKSVNPNILLYTVCPSSGNICNDPLKTCTSQVDLCSFAKWLAFAGNDALFGAPLKVEFQIAIHPVHFFVVPSFAILAHACEAFPKAPS